jgi:site-specific DNA-methyltransferase (adenine-specific)
MGKQWDTGEVAHDPAFWAEVYRVLKPGAHLAAFGGTRTYHRMVCAIEDAGFEIRDCVCWLYATGFPKSHDVSKAIDKAARGVPHGGADPTSPHHGQYKGGCSDENPTGRGFGAGPGRFMRDSKYAGAITRGDSGPTGNKRCETCGKWLVSSNPCQCPRPQDAPITDEAQRWQGWGSSLKPAFEPVVLARKPLVGTIADNVLAHGTGALNIDGCRIEHVTVDDGNLALNPHLRKQINGGNGGNVFPRETDRRVVTPNELGRWPANVCHDGSDEVLAAFPDSAGQQGDVRGTEPSAKHKTTWGTLHQRKPFSKRDGEASASRRYTDNGSTNFAALPGARRAAETSAARFFFSAKAGPLDRQGSRHPTVKPVALIRWLMRLITPPGGTVLDPFAGSGTAGVAALAEGFDAVLIEREAEYIADIEARLAYYRGEGAHSLAVKNRNRRAADPDAGADLFA